MSNRDDVYLDIKLIQYRKQLEEKKKREEVQLSRSTKSLTRSLNDLHQRVTKNLGTSFHRPH